MSTRSGLSAVTAGLVGLSTAVLGVGTPALATAPRATPATAAALTARWVGPAQVGEGALAAASVQVTASRGLRDVVVSVSGVGTPELRGAPVHAVGALSAGATGRVASPFVVRRDGTGTLHAAVTALDAAGTTVRTAVELDVASGAGQAVLSRSGLLDAQVAVLGLQRAALGEAAYAQRLADLQGGGAQQQVSVSASKPDSGSSHETTVSGTIRYTASNGTVHPARSIAVELRDADGTAGGKLVKAATTSSTGTYAITGSTLRPNGTSRKLYVKALAKGAGYVVRGATATVPQAIVSTSTTATGAPVTVNLTANNTADNNTAFDVADAMTSAIVYTRRINGGALLSPSLTISFPDPDGTNFSPSLNKARILKLDRFDWDVTFHEYGHFVAARLGFADSPGGSHSYSDNLAEIYGKADGIRLAWSEGFATAFALMAEDTLNVAALAIPDAGDAFYDDTEDADFHVAYQTNTGLVSKGEDNELSTGRVLWHLYQDPGIAIPDTTIMSTLAATGPDSFSEGIAALLPAAGAALFDDSESVVAARVAESNTVACVVTAQVISPKVTAPAAGATVTAASPPTVTWLPNGAGPSNRLNRFTVQFWSPSWDTRLFESPTLSAKTYKPSAGTWAGILQQTDGNGDLPAQFNIVIKGTGLNAPVTGPYKSCGRTVSVSR